MEDFEKILRNEILGRYNATREVLKIIARDKKEPTSGLDIETMMYAYSNAKELSVLAEFYNKNFNKDSIHKDMLEYEQKFKRLSNFLASGLVGLIKMYMEL